MSEWHEFRLWWDINRNPDNVFAFKKTNMLPILEKYGVEDFLMLDEPEFVLVRIDIDGKSAKLIYSDLKKVIQAEPLFLEVTVESWSPTEDARNRILSARGKVPLPADIPEGGWMIKGKNPSSNSLSRFVYLVLSLIRRR